MPLKVFEIIYHDLRFTRLVPYLSTPHYKCNAVPGELLSMFITSEKPDIWSWLYDASKCISLQIMHKYFEVITYSIVHRPCKISAGNCTELNIGPNKDLCGSLHPQHSRLSNDSPARMEPFKNVCDAYIMIHHPIRVHMTFILFLLPQPCPNSFSLLLFLSLS